MPRYKESERVQIKFDTRQLLLQAATEVFARDGYEKANINRISKTAGFAKGTIYNYFESKRALMCPSFASWFIRSMAPMRNSDWSSGRSINRCTN